MRIDALLLTAKGKIVSFLLNAYRHIFARSKFQKLNKLIFRLSLSGLGVSNFENSRVSGERHFIRNVLPKFISPGAPVFMDVGANVGEYTRCLQEQFPNALIYAFEPHPKNFARLCERKNANLRLYNLGLGEKKGILRLYDRADYDGSAHASLYEEVITEIHKRIVKAVEVQVDTLDNVAENNNVRHIDLLKIDTEGHDLAVLRGSKRLLDVNAVGIIQFELNEMNIMARVFFRDFRRLLGNYAFYRLLPKDLIPLDDNPLFTEIFAYQNVVAIPKNKVSMLNS
jgi:FkbM family methyltransferase